MQFILIIMAISIGSSALPTKRQAQNSYGDEPQTPAPTSYSEATTGAAVEYAPHEVAQEAVSAAAPVQSSGYRHKRQAQNSYGDEAQTPAPSTYSGASAAVSAETAPAQVAQESAPAAAVVSSGYRHKRQTQNTYGDEPQTPAPSTYSGASAAVSSETASAQVAQESAPAAAVVSSGYRHKRQAQNSYGDEPQTPAPSSYSEATTGAAVEYAPHEVAQEAVSAAAPVESSGYRQ